MPPFISHHREDGDVIAQSHRFKTLSVEQRLELLCEWTDFCLELNPALALKKHAQPIPGRVQVFTAEQGQVRGDRRNRGESSILLDHVPATDAVRLLHADSREAGDQTLV